MKDTPVQNWRFGPGATITAIFLCLALFGSILAPYTSNYAEFERNLGSSLDHWLGIDGLGRDLFSQYLHGAWPALYAPVLAILLASVAGVPMGLLLGRLLRPVIQPNLERKKSRRWRIWRLRWLWWPLRWIVRLVWLYILFQFVSQIIFYLRTSFSPGLSSAVIPVAFLVSIRFISLGFSQGIQKGQLSQNKMNLLKRWVPTAVSALAPALFWHVVVEYVLGQGILPPEVSWGQLLNGLGFFFLTGQTVPFVFILLSILLYMVGFSWLGKSLQSSSLTQSWNEGVYRGDKGLLTIQGARRLAYLPGTASHLVANRLIQGTSVAKHFWQERGQALFETLPIRSMLSVLLILGVGYILWSFSIGQIEVANQCPGTVFVERRLFLPTLRVESGTAEIMTVFWGYTLRYENPAGQPELLNLTLEKITPITTERFSAGAKPVIRHLDDLNPSLFEIVACG